MNDKCFAMNARQDCIALNNRNCVGHAECPFYKTRSQEVADRVKANARLCALPMEQQEAIANKYFGGSMPWRKGV